MVHDIERSGAQLKDVELGLVDFPGQVNGRPALLCWQFGSRRWRSGIARARSFAVGSPSPAPRRRVLQ